MRAADLLLTLALAIPAALAFAASAHAADAKDAGRGPADVAARFLQAFEKKDYQTLRTLFAPGAVVSTVNLARGGAPTLAYKPLDEWIEETRKEMAPVTFEKVETLDTSVLAFDEGATVSVRFRATGKAGDASFTNNGIDTYSLARVDGAWRIVRYGTFELLEFK